MPNKMLIDASHPEETRVVVTRGNRIEEFDFESQDKKQLRGNIYLARVTRVEPSLQAAFVEYGGNRHGFLAFNEIHPDYYQIPVADRQALLRAEAEAAQAEEDEDAEADERPSRERGRRRKRGGKAHAREKAAAEAAETGENQDTPAAAEGDADAAPEAVESDSGTPAEAAGEAGEAVTDEAADTDTGGNGGPNVIAAAVAADVVSEPLPDASDEEAAEEKAGRVEEVNGSNGEDSEIESVGAEDALEEVHTRRRPLRRQYKIQEVIKRRQILLVQVVKEERGNKGAALTTYLSLAGRYSVLMPNTARGGGISRKITNAQDRKRLKDVVKDLDVPQGMGVILRTAGENRTKAEIKRDYEYLMRLWENVRNLTLQSTAPALVYEEGSLIKRSVRDLYNKDIDEILVSGEDGYREAKDFMRMLMPSHAKVVQPYRDAVPIFARNGIEAQLDRMLQPQVTLKSGGYIIINQTEALVAIDVNSGRSTREHSIEDTALQTNLEAAEEVARQLRLRDLAGLIVIDFIDMEENRNNRAVEKKLKDCLKNDRARIQVGRISHFGLMEMSRQRIRASVLESTMKPCPHCGGTGHVRSDSSVALYVIRAIEEFLLKDSRNHINVRTPSSTALYVLNHKRSNLIDLENRFGLTITIEADETLGAQHYAIVKGAPAERRAPALPDGAPLDTSALEAMEAEEEAEETEESQARDDRQPHGAEEGETHRDRRRKRRRRRRGGREDAVAAADNGHMTAERPEAAADTAEAAFAENGEAGQAQHAEAGASEERKKRRRGKRGGKRNRHSGDHTAEEAGEEDLSPDLSAEGADESPEETDTVAAETLPEPLEAAHPLADEPAEPIKAPRRRSRKSGAEPATANGIGEAPAEAAASSETVVANGRDATPAETHAEPAEAEADATEAQPEPQPVPVVTSSGQPAGDEKRPRKSGWWQRKGFF